MSRTPQEIIAEIEALKNMDLKEIAEAVAVIPEIESVQEFCHIYDEDNLAIFPDFTKFFYWLHQEQSNEELIQLLLEERDLTKQADYYQLKSGKVVFLYQ